MMLHLKQRFGSLVEPFNSEEWFFDFIRLCSTDLECESQLLSPETIHWDLRREQCLGALYG